MFFFFSSGRSRCLRQVRGGPERWDVVRFRGKAPMIRSCCGSPVAAMPEPLSIRVAVSDNRRLVDFQPPLCKRPALVSARVSVLLRIAAHGWRSEHRSRQTQRDALPDHRPRRRTGQRGGGWMMTRFFPPRRRLKLVLQSLLPAIAGSSMCIPSRSRSSLAESSNERSMRTAVRKWLRARRSSPSVQR